ncbi:uncharacterized protein AB675_3676 [Cyphellophora attinorum]|uniref:Uncharacterized protein n=1 Tax=Cyphellophora attinorum TaxID=1664694 RepID=A0A0N1H6N4_9EURO|nr:uncharacterized protein AB675_3676 [Phialophora attinorum]KPI37062.1 hypothetical protein AB675_3676 [Phialophora attinorum]
MPRQRMTLPAGREALARDSQVPLPSWSLHINRNSVDRVISATGANPELDLDDIKNTRVRRQVRTMLVYVLDVNVEMCYIALMECHNELDDAICLILDVKEELDRQAKDLRLREEDNRQVTRSGKKLTPAEIAANLDKLLFGASFDDSATEDGATVSVAKYNSITLTTELENASTRPIKTTSSCTQTKAVGYRILPAGHLDSISPIEYTLPKWLEVNKREEERQGADMRKATTTAASEYGTDEEYEYADKEFREAVIELNEDEKIEEGWSLIDGTSGELSEVKPEDFIY